MERLAQAIGTAREDSANLRTVKACSRVTPGNHSRNWSTVAPPSRFSKSACTGTRVPLNTQAPLTLPGTRSTAAHFDQSNMHRKLRCHLDTGKREVHFRSSGVALGVEQSAENFHGAVVHLQRIVERYLVVGGSGGSPSSLRN